MNCQFLGDRLIENDHEPDTAKTKSIENVLSIYFAVNKFQPKIRQGGETRDRKISIPDRRIIFLPGIDISVHKFLAVN